MADPAVLEKLEGEIKAAQEAAQFQGDSVRSLKALAKEGKAEKVRGAEREPSTVRSREEGAKRRHESRINFWRF
jgi:hypothetical protein